jgi:uncharacterized protein
MNSISVRLALTLLLGMAAAGPAHAGYRAAASDPTPAEIYLAAERNLAQAQQMIQNVLKRHPESALAHWVAAVIDVRAANYLVANQELARAEQLAPGLPFVSPNAVADLQQQLVSMLGSGAPEGAHVARAYAAIR